MLKYLEQVLPQNPNTYCRVAFSIDGIGDDHDKNSEHKRIQGIIIYIWFDNVVQINPDKWQSAQGHDYDLESNGKMKPAEISCVEHWQQDVIRKQYDIADESGDEQRRHVVEREQ